MQFFDLSRKFNLNNLLTPNKTLADLSESDWFLAKIRIDHDCLSDTETLEGQVILQSSQNIQITLAWIIQDTGHELQLLFKGIETEESQSTWVTVTGAQLVDDQAQRISTQALTLWIDGTLVPMIPNIRREIKTRLNLWDYVEYDN